MTVVEALYIDPETETHLTGAEQLEVFFDKYPSTQGLYGTSTNIVDGVYLSPNAFSKDVSAEALPRFVGVELVAGAQLGAGDSQHGVLFGDIVVDYVGQRSKVKSAIKPFLTESGAARHEYDSLVAAKEMGFDTFEPIALAKDGDTMYLITRRRGEVESLDNANWTIVPSDQAAYEAEVVPNLHFIAQSMAKMHAKGLIHGDPQIKNFARSDTGNLVVIDLESAKIARNSEEHALLVGSGDEVCQFWYAAIHHINDTQANILLEGESYETCMAEFEINFMTPYLKALSEHADPSFLESLNLEELRTQLYLRVGRTT